MRYELNISLGDTDVLEAKIEVEPLDINIKDNEYVKSNIRFYNVKV